VRNGAGRRSASAEVWNPRIGPAETWFGLSAGVAAAIDPASPGRGWRIGE